MPRLPLILTIAFLAPLHGEDMDLHARLAPVPPEAKFESKNYFIWGAGMVRDDQGTCHLFVF